MNATPGPWTVQRLENKRERTVTFAVHNKQVLTIADVYDDSGAADSVEQGEANAALIAAAPELLEALKKIEVGSSRYDKVDDCAKPELLKVITDIARAAITKAKGGA